eukprot:TRINITY_DN4949_c0_g1_i1.p1 TRINITY_DN4949_c0_g1~~TRINITY_DN4949_c0_g1_i1.p1  ORF type:complete len:482 (-),score=45.90 TRINITY_DN4949_c0_g1_i1:353-1798(-)
MVVVPFGSGVVAAFIFLIFELLVFPLLMYSTTKIASIIVYWHARKGNHVKVDSMSFPLWSDGLLRYYLSHKPLLVIRIILIVIPVYLETRLIGSEVPEMIPATFKTALVPSPAVDWLDYQNKSGEQIGFLRLLSERAYSSCTYSDFDGWLWARLANVTYVSDNKQLIHCVPGTQQIIFRPSEEIIDFSSESFRERLSVNVSWVEGCAQHFPKDLLLQDQVDSDLNVTAYRLLTLSVVNVTNMRCFFADSVKMSMKGSFPTWDVWCEKQDGNVVYYYFILFSMEQLPVNQLGVTDYCSNGRNPSSLEQHPDFLRKIATAEVDIWYRESLEFQDKILLSAKHLANLDPDNDNPNLVRPSEISRAVLYTQKDNLTVEVPLEQVFQHTEIDAIVIIIGMAEALIVVFFSFALVVALRGKWKYIQEPNTVNGLSRCWAESEAVFQEGEECLTWIDLGLSTSGAEENEARFFVPSRQERTDFQSDCI